MKKRASNTHVMVREEHADHILQEAKRLSNTIGKNPDLEDVMNMENTLGSKEIDSKDSLGGSDTNMVDNGESVGMDKVVWGENHDISEATKAEKLSKVNLQSEKQGTAKRELGARNKESDDVHSKNGRSEWWC